MNCGGLNGNLAVREDDMNERLVFGSPIDDPLDRLYARHVAQTDALETYFTARAISRGIRRVLRLAPRSA
jgi:hypothetical protein